MIKRDKHIERLGSGYGLLFNRKMNACLVMARINESVEVFRTRCSIQNLLVTVLLFDFENRDVAMTCIVSVAPEISATIQSVLVSI